MNYPPPHEAFSGSPLLPPLDPRFPQGQSPRCFFFPPVPLDRQGICLILRQNLFSAFSRLPLLIPGLFKRPFIIPLLQIKRTPFPPFSGPPAESFSQQLFQMVDETTAAPYFFFYASISRSCERVAVFSFFSPRILLIPAKFVLPLFFGVSLLKFFFSLFLSLLR